MANHVHTDHSKEFAAVGDTIDVERPQRFAGQEDNLDITSYREDLIGGKVPLSLSKTFTVAFDIDAIDLTLSVKDSRIKEKYIDPVMIKMKDKIESHILSQYWRFPHFYGTPGTTPSTFKDLATPRAILTDGGIPLSNRVAVHNTEAAVELADGLKGVYVQDKARKAYEEAAIGKYGGFMNFESVHLPTHTVGDYGGTLLVNGANQNVNYSANKDSLTSTLAIDGGTNSTTGFLKQGDVITIAGVYAINPITKQSTGRLQTFTIYEDADTNGSGQTTLTICPAIIVAGTGSGQDAIANNAFATVSAVPADNAAITVKTGTANTSYKQSILFNKPAFTFVTRPLAIPANDSFKTSSASGNLTSIACSKGGDINTLKSIWRWDMLYDATSLEPMHALRLTS